MPRTSSAYASIPPIDWLKEALDLKLEITGINVWKALRHPSFVQVISRQGEIMSEVSRLSDVGSFRVTHRGIDFLAEHEATTLAFKKNDPPPSIRYWLSAFRRLARNCPKELQLTFSEGQLRVLANNTEGKAKDNDLHLVESVKVPWLSI